MKAASGAVSPLLVLPALVNAHDHGRAVRTSSIGAAGKPLEAWLHYLALFPSVDPYAAAVVALSRSALGGVGTVMMHYTRAQGFTDLPTEVKEVARAAKRCRRACRFRRLHEGPQSAGLRPVRTDPCRASRERTDRDRKEISAKAAVARGICRTRGCGRGRRREPYVRRAIRPERRAMVQRCVAGSRRAGLAAHRPARPHASSGNALSARLDGQSLSRWRGEASRHDRAPLAAPDPGALRLGAAG